MKYPFRSGNRYTDDIYHANFKNYINSKSKDFSLKNITAFLNESNKYSHILKQLTKKNIEYLTNFKDCNEYNKFVSENIGYRFIYFIERQFFTFEFRKYAILISEDGVNIASPEKITLWANKVVNGSETFEPTISIKDPKCENGGLSFIGNRDQIDNEDDPLLNLIPGRQKIFSLRDLYFLPQSLLTQQEEGFEEIVQLPKTGNTRSGAVKDTESVASVKSKTAFQLESSLKDKEKSDTVKETQFISSGKSEAALPTASSLKEEEKTGKVREKHLVPSESTEFNSTEKFQVGEDSEDGGVVLDTPKKEHREEKLSKYEESYF